MNASQTLNWAARPDTVRIYFTAVNPFYFAWPPVVWWLVLACTQVFECLRRLLLTGLLVFLVPDTAGQVAFGCIFAFLR